MSNKDSKIGELPKALEKSQTDLGNIQKERDAFNDGNMKLEEDVKQKDVNLLKLVEEKKNVVDTVESWWSIFYSAYVKMRTIFPIC